MAEVAVVPRRHAEHAHHVERHAQHQHPGRHTRPDGSQAGQVHQDERDGGGVDDVVVKLFFAGVMVLLWLALRRRERELERKGQDLELADAR